MERKTLRIKLKDKISCRDIRDKTGIKDVFAFATKQKWTWEAMSQDSNATDGPKRLAAKKTGKITSKTSKKVGDRSATKSTALVTAILCHSSLLANNAVETSI
ncbi:hypothetical protein ElyMa_003040500 [Elysia marginata]|uniref:Uncharacterized protein n=1 Tax=Elysia marginata TaxID=1093978 RepID=A0AAV4IHW4_9GAST|nr:hypothetical protein ElyMa_003040500 [Elysia marginata]